MAHEAVVSQVEGQARLIEHRLGLVLDDSTAQRHRDLAVLVAYVIVMIGLQAVVPAREHVLDNAGRHDEVVRSLAGRIVVGHVGREVAPVARAALMEAEDAAHLAYPAGQPQDARVLAHHRPVASRAGNHVDAQASGIDEGLRELDGRCAVCGGERAAAAQHRAIRVRDDVPDARELLCHGLR